MHANYFIFNYVNLGHVLFVLIIRSKIEGQKGTTTILTRKQRHRVLKIASTMVKIEELNRKRSSAKKKFDDKVKSFEFVLEARPEIHSLEEAFGEVKVKYKAVRELHDGITDLMVEADIEKADFTNHDIFVTEIIAKYGDLLSKLEQM